MKFSVHFQHVIIQSLNYGKIALGLEVILGCYDNNNNSITDFVDHGDL